MEVQLCRKHGQYLGSDKRRTIRGLYLQHAFSWQAWLCTARVLFRPPQALAQKAPTPPN